MWCGTAFIVVSVSWAVWAQEERQDPPERPFESSSLAEAEKLIGLPMTEAERELMLDSLVELLGDYGELRKQSPENGLAPALVFDPFPTGWYPETGGSAPVFTDVDVPQVPENLEDCAYWPVTELAALLRTGKVSATDLTRMYLGRLKKYGSKLECVVTLTEERALAQARRADEEIAAGKYRGPLHGIPYGAKDLLAVAGIATTWGAAPFKDQVLDETATVIQRLDEAGAVMVAKLTLGALAWGDVWYGGMTRNPWNVEQGSSGSSAGSAAATAAGLVAFALGSETYGSIVSPSTRCGTTGLRPTFGRVPRTGAMALSWSMDKIGPICRTVEDCALVFSLIQGRDGKDPSAIDGSFSYKPVPSLNGITVGYLKEAFEEDHQTKVHDLAALEKLKALGAVLKPMDLPDVPVGPLALILTAEAAAAFDELTRSGRDDLLTRQIERAWPNTFRYSRFIPAVEYIQANRIRERLIQEMAKLLDGVDLYVSPTFGANNLLLTNLTGHPCVVLPNGFSETGAPVSITFIGKLFDEAGLLAAAKVYQDATDHHLKHPPDFP